MWITKANYLKDLSERYESGKRDGAAHLEGEKRDLEAKYNKSEADRIEIQKKHDALLPKLRKQSENDMIAEAVKLILTGVKKEEEITTQEHYKRMLAAQQNMQLYGYRNQPGMGGLLDSVNYFR